MASAPVENDAGEQRSPEARSAAEMPMSVDGMLAQKSAFLQALHVRLQCAPFFSSPAAVLSCVRAWRRNCQAAVDDAIAERKKIDARVLAAEVPSWTANSPPGSRLLRRRGGVLTNRSTGW
jgi:hypothetical protein